MHTSLTSASSPASVRRAKIVATIGPASNTETVFRGLLRAGMDVARLNFSHGTHPEKVKLIQLIRRVAAEEGKHICILADLQGPKIRTGRLKNRLPVSLKTGQQLTITPRDIPGTSAVIGTTFATLAENLEEGSRILLSDGLIELRVRRIQGHRRYMRSDQWRDTGRIQGNQSAGNCGASALVDAEGRSGSCLRD